VAADLPVRAPAYKAPPPVVVWSWTGFYIGVNGGYSFGNDRLDQIAVQNGIVGPSLEKGIVAPRGGIFGGQLGYNWQVGSVVLGLEGDAQWSGQRDTVCGPQFCQTNPGITLATLVEHKLKWFATARGRIGWANEGYLIYVTGGGAWGSVDETDTLINTNLLPAPVVASFSQTKGGWTVGAGIEAHLAGNWTAKLEYLHFDLGSTSNVLPVPAINATLTTNSRIRDDIVRAGINYKFGFAPVVASY
jgi:outer membrane immunogenic protein